MPTDLFSAQTGRAFVAPIHPGEHPVHLANATQHQITETNCQYAPDLVEHTCYNTVNQELKMQLLLAVTRTYLCILANADLGFIDVLCSAMLTHFKTNCSSRITPKEL